MTMGVMFLFLEACKNLRGDCLADVWNHKEIRVTSSKRTPDRAEDLLSHFLFVFFFDGHAESSLMHQVCFASAINARKVSS